MKSTPFRFIAVLALAILAATRTFAAEPAIIAKARARLGSDAVLDALKSVHYVGTLTVKDAADPKKVVTQSIEIYLQKPARQRIEVTSADSRDVSVLDGYDAWQRTTDLKTKQWRQSVFSAVQIKGLRSDVWENLSYFRGIEKVGGWVKDFGPATVDGIACQKLGFYHSEALVYFRYIDVTTGRLVMTGTDDNATREEGEVFSGGIRFPRTMTITRKDGGKTLIQTITFEKVTVNETFPDSLFATPLATVN